MTRLTDKINTYTLSDLFKFDESSLVLPPVNTINTWNSSLWSYTGNTNGALYSTSTGPMPGQGSYGFISDASRAGRIRHGSSTSEQTWAAGIRDQDYSAGFWVRINQWTPTDCNLITILNATGAGLPPSATYEGFGVSHATNAGVKFINVTTGGVTTNINSDHNNNPLLIERWYFVAIRKFLADATTVTTEVYLNGVLKNTFNHTKIDGLVTFINFGQQITNLSANYQIGCFYIATASNVNAAAIGALFDYGSTIQAQIKHYDGTAWQTALASQVYYGGAWHDVWASKWTGTAWEPI